MKVGLGEDERATGIAKGLTRVWAVLVGLCAVLAHFRLVIFVSLRMVASAEAPSALIQLLSRL